MTQIINLTEQRLFYKKINDTKLTDDKKYIENNNYLYKL